MSVLVKGMKMPTGCDDCPLYGIDMRCNITYTPNYTDGRFVERLGNCPIVDVPAPRSRLIDADALTDNWYYASAALRPDDVKKVVCLDDIDNVPTIIEAEG